MTKEEKQNLYEAIISDVAIVVKQRIEELCAIDVKSDELNENVDAATEKKTKNS